MLTIPQTSNIIELPTLKMGFDDEGILYVVYKKIPQRTLTDTKQSMQAIKDFIGDRRVCILLDVTYSAESNREIRSYTAEEIPKVAKAIAIVSDSALGKMMANLFFSLAPQPFPAQLFHNVTAAKEWLRNHQ